MYSHNKNGLPTSIMFGTKSVTFDHVWEQQRKTTLPNGVTTDYQYNDASWLDDIKVKKSSTFLVNNHYLFDNVGNITGMTTIEGSRGYGYDDLYQLTHAEQPALPTENITYDGVGNRLTSTTGSDPTLSYTHNDNNELVSFGTASFVYDANGNTIRKILASGETTAYVYDSRDRLKRVELPDGRIAIYKYDPFGRRVSKQIDAMVTYLVYSDEGLVAEYDASGAMLKGYGWKPDGIWGTDPVFMLEGGQYYYYHNDHLGTPQKMTNGSGNIVWSAEYSAFGQALVTVSTVTSNLRFPGQYFDEETGLHYNWNRYYDPVTGRYTQVDPIGFAAEDANLYRYALNNSVYLIDPLGLKVCAPGTLESLIPVWGSGKAAINAYQNGNYGTAAFQTAVAVSDVFLVKAIATGVAKGAWKLGSHTWSATSKWLTKKGWREFPGQEMHHWLIPQGGWGSIVPNAIKNQPWNLMGMPNRGFHEALHGWGEMNLAERLWFGTPNSAKLAGLSAAGRIANGAGGSNECGCD